MKIADVARRRHARGGKSRPAGRRSRDRPCATSLADPFADRYSLQAIATLPRARFVEFNVSRSSLTRGVARTSFELAGDGTVPISDTPGIGMEVDLDFIVGHRVN